MIKLGTVMNAYMQIKELITVSDQILKLSQEDNKIDTEIMELNIDISFIANKLQEAIYEIMDEGSEIPEEASDFSSKKYREQGYIEDYYSNI